MPGMNKPKFKKETLYVLPLLLLLATDELFYPFAEEGGFASIYEDLATNLVKLTGLLSVGMVFLYINKFNKGLLIVLVFAIIYLVILAFESMYLYSSAMQYPHVILKLFNLFVALAIFAVYADRYAPNFQLIMPFVIVGLLLQIALNPEMFSLQAFVDRNRGLPAPSVFILCLPCIFYFNRYLISLKPVELLIFLFIFVFILIANHRTVWVTIAFSLLINLFLLRNSIHFNIGKVLGSLILVIVIAGFVFSIAISYSAEVEETIITNITNILNPTEDKTGSWRMEQMKSYLPVVENNLLAGMRWKGFELPIQFYHPDAGIALFEDGSGHHFHSFYFDILFYFGIVGLLLFILLMTWPLTTMLNHHLQLNSLTLSFFIFSLSGLVYGLAYNLPFSYWIIIGITIVQVNRALKDNQGGVNKSISVD
jgi:hypothetical protein